PNIKRLIPYLTHYQCISLKRTKEFFQDCFGHSISEGTLVNHTRGTAEIRVKIGHRLTSISNHFWNRIFSFLALLNYIVDN
ncbi:hypothetical protein BLX06_35030, partial [Bacillus cereus]